MPKPRIVILAGPNGAGKTTASNLVNRVLGPYLDQALRMVEEGLSAETVDAAATRFGMPMGPIELADTVGPDICIAAGESLAAASAAAGQPATVPKKPEQLVAAGNLGKKSGGGYYTWREGKPAKGAPSAVSEELIERLLVPSSGKRRRWWPKASSPMRTS